MTKQKNNLAYKEDADRSNINNQARVIDFDNHVKKKKRFSYTPLHWKQIPRANNPNKALQSKAVSLLSTIVFKLQKNEVVVLNHNYLSRITDCEKDQNVNLLKQLADVLDITFSAKIIINGKIRRNSYVIKHTEKGYKIIKNAEVLFAQKHFVGKVAVTPIEKPSIGEEKTNTSTEFFPPSNLYKEKLFENNRSSESNFLDNSNFSILPSETSNIVETKKRNQSEDGSTEATIHVLKPNKANLSIKPANQRKKPTKADNKAKKAKLLRFQQYEKSKSLSEHYPLKPEDCSVLQSKSGRNFNTNAINEILLSLSNKQRQKEYKFLSKTSFMAYMTKVLRNEMRDEVKTSNIRFKIKANLTPKQIVENTTYAQRESYLGKIEDRAIRHRSDETQLMAKLVGVLAPNLAYNLLSNIVSIKANEEVFEILLRQDIEINERTKALILSQIKAVGYDAVERVEFIEVAKKSFVAKSNSKQTKSELPKTIWGEIRSGLISTYGTDVDRAWFKDIESTENQETKTIKLKAESSFKQSWIKENYLIVIEQIAKSKDYAIETIEC